MDKFSNPYPAIFEGLETMPNSLRYDWVPKKPDKRMKEIQKIEEKIELILETINKGEEYTISEDEAKEFDSFRDWVCKTINITFHMRQLSFGEPVSFIRTALDTDPLEYLEWDVVSPLYEVVTGLNGDGKYDDLLKAFTYKSAVPAFLRTENPPYADQKEAILYLLEYAILDLSHQLDQRTINKENANFYLHFLEAQAENYRMWLVADFC